MTYSITGLPIEPFLPFIGLSERELTARHIVRVTADAPSKYPCRVLLEDAKPGDTLLLLNHEYQPAQSPYKGAMPYSSMSRRRLPGLSRMRSHPCFSRVRPSRCACL